MWDSWAQCRVQLAFSRKDTFMRLQHEHKMNCWQIDAKKSNVDTALQSILDFLNGRLAEFAVVPRHSMRSTQERISTVMQVKCWLMHLEHTWLRSNPWPSRSPWASASDRASRTPHGRQARCSSSIWGQEHTPFAKNLNNVVGLQKKAIVGVFHVLHLDWWDLHRRETGPCSLSSKPTAHSSHLPLFSIISDWNLPVEMSLLAQNKIPCTSAYLTEVVHVHDHF